jgi:D-alanyl-lipoteichoic acid acyltransferase DltB (MBOAT superfamily)
MGNHLTGTGDPQKSVLIMLVANLLYVYLDFSAYCDLAIGAARAGGRRLPENFNWPLVRGGLRRYWRHWHMTLSQWVMRRVYFPAFLASHSTTLALIASMLTIGLWHAPTISWTLWALHHSLAMAAEGRINPDPPSGEAQPGSLAMRVTAAGRHFVGMIFMLGWVSLGHAFTLFAAPRVAIETYLAALSAPFIILWRLCS